MPSIIGVSICMTLPSQAAVGSPAGSLERVDVGGRVARAGRPGAGPSDVASRSNSGR